MLKMFVILLYLFNYVNHMQFSFTAAKCDTIKPFWIELNWIEKSEIKMY